MTDSPLPGQGFELDWLGTADNNAGIVLSDSESACVIFRGTRVEVDELLSVAEIVRINQRDIVIDSEFLPAVDDAGGKVHSGFLEALKPICGQLDVIASNHKGKKIWLTGHSLGGALATLAAARMGRANVQGLYTYGCPRVGDAAFVTVLPGESYFRFVHRDDWIPRVPPDTLGYVHGGEEIAVAGDDPRGVISELELASAALISALKVMMEEQRLTVGGIPFLINGLADHAPIYYATLLWNTLLAGMSGA